MVAMQATSTSVARSAVNASRIRTGPPEIVQALCDIARKAMYRTGALSFYHRLRNRNVLTVALFHRVLKRDDPRWETALHEWTLTDDVFDECLTFFKRHYTLVALDDVKAALKGVRRLPPRSLLITFDDGFSDNSDYALPLLRKHGAAATMFISSEIIGRDERLWTEDLLWAFAAGRLHQRDIAGLYRLLMGEAARDEEDPLLVWELVRRGPGFEQARVEASLSALKINLNRVQYPRQMLSSGEITNLSANGFSIGAHGKTHTALPFASDLTSELCSPRVVLESALVPHRQCSIDAISFPHGAYTSEIVDRALSVGYLLAFTSDAELPKLKSGFLTSPLIGRIGVNGADIAPGGTFRPELLAAALFTVPRKCTGDTRKQNIRSERESC